MVCAECGKPISLDTGYCEYEGGTICLDCDAKTNPLPSDEDRKPMTDEEFTAAEDAMHAAGIRDGLAAASWLVDGNTTKEQAAKLLEQIDNCELDSPNPLSGEWAGDPTLADLIGRETECDAESLTDEARDCLATAYEDGYAEGYHCEAERVARLHADG